MSPPSERLTREETDAQLAAAAAEIVREPAVRHITRDELAELRRISSRVSWRPEEIEALNGLLFKLLAEHDRLAAIHP